MSDPTPGQEPITPAVEPTPVEPTTPPKVDVVPKAEADKLYARAKQAEDAEKRLKEENAALKAAQTPVPQADDLEERVDLRLSGYSADEIKFIKQNQKSGQSLVEAAKNTFVADAIESARSKAKVAGATPTPSSRSNPVINGKSFRTR